ncbi:MAG TPA: DNA repair protein RecO [bacterium]
MHVLTTEGIVLRAKPFGESDIIVSLFTQKAGRLSCIAKGAKRSRKRFGANLQPSSHGNFLLSIRNPNSLAMIDYCDLIEWWDGIYSDVEAFVFSQYSLELIYKLLPEGEENQKIFDYLLIFHNRLNSKKFNELTVRTFEAGLLSFLGYRPLISHCGKCKKELIEEKVIFDPEKGQVLCSGCYTEKDGGFIISPGTLSLLNYLIEDREEKHYDILSLEVKRDLKKLLWNFIIYINQGPMNSWRLFEE